MHVTIRVTLPSFTIPNDPTCTTDISYAVPILAYESFGISNVRESFWYRYFRIVGIGELCIIIRV